MSYLLLVMLNCAFLMTAFLQYDEKSVLSIMKEAEVVVIADVVKVYPSHGIWSGPVASVQHIKYEVVEVLKGEVNSKDIDAGHYVVFNSLTADKDYARLSPKLFKPGNRLILSLSRERGHECKLDRPPEGVEAFCSPNQNSGAVLAAPQLIDKIREVINSQ
jgi:hypothetical protein